MSAPRDIVEKIKEKYHDKEGGFELAIGRLEQLVDHDGVEVKDLRNYAIAEAEECKRRAEYLNRPAVSRFYNDKVSI
jgi:hypothetical protein